MMTAEKNTLNAEKRLNDMSNKIQWKKGMITMKKIFQAGRKKVMKRKTTLLLFLETVTMSNPRSFYLTRVCTFTFN